MTLLTRLLARRSFALPEFDLAPLAFHYRQLGEMDELLLDRAVTPVAGESNIVALTQPLPTPGELRETIETHLEVARTGDPQQRPIDPAEELRNALADLRRSLAS